MRNYLGLLLLSLGAAACGNNSTAADMSVAVDMTLGPDIAMRTPDGVKCGTSTTCTVGKECCITFANNMATGAMCIDSGGQCAGATLACDGPEDCNAKPTDTCCAQIDIGGGGDAGAMFAGGNSMCGSCTPAFTGSTLTTRLCHATADCANFSINFGITVALDKCCSTSASANTQFCAPDPSVLAQLGQTANYTCL